MKKEKEKVGDGEENVEASDFSREVSINGITSIAVTKSKKGTTENRAETTTNERISRVPLCITYSLTYKILTFLESTQHIMTQARIRFQEAQALRGNRFGLALITTPAKGMQINQNVTTARKAATN